MRNKLIEALDKKQIKQVPEFRVGDNVKVNVRIKEGNKERIQTFEGLVITKKGQGTGSSLVVRKISYGIGVERTFLVNSPLISGIEVIRSNKVRKARLFYMRDRKGKSARLKEIKR
ncbi:50S ribosomal protein L19 [Candidatus Mycoplasma mahonii]|uniref:50S ribosomal protein L19 n=1 Tax=Candidatus Mycoplasma mahonii TaxID=3004105 RepID=UPI0026EA9E50|nr:50S ribosomal protein L19 [Candidatus Mycoplasma mahonii]WKX02625.1 50S ribosomal protein L19 [Candidatus Mycoplasma mahonii]